METQLLKAKIEDTAKLCVKNSAVRFLGFLSQEQAVFAADILKRQKVDFEFFGGFDGAKRVMLGCFPEGINKKSFPIVAVTFEFRKSENLSHRDFLGSLMALKISRESVGEILIGEGRAIAFVTKEVAPLVLEEINKIGRVGVKVTEGIIGELPKTETLAEFTATVASLRLDCVVAAICNYSRSAACEKIELGLVSVNSVETEKITKVVASGDIITVRGKGKFIIESLDDKTRKNRNILRYKKYI
jgi:RNA-binding protein YlmH